jgi:hypothetical protein
MLVDRDDLVLYTITSDSVLRIFMPVLDSLKYLQLHGAIDVPFIPSKSKGKQKHNPPPGGSSGTSTTSIFWLDRKVVDDALGKILEDMDGKGEGGKCSEEEETRRRRAKEVIDEGWDLFLRVMSDGSVLITAVAVSSFTFPIYIVHSNQGEVLEHRRQTTALPQTIHPPTNAALRPPLLTLTIPTTKIPIYLTNTHAHCNNTNNFSSPDRLRTRPAAFLL